MSNGQQQRAAIAPVLVKPAAPLYGGPTLLREAGMPSGVLENMRGTQTGALHDEPRSNRAKLLFAKILRHS